MSSVNRKLRKWIELLDKTDSMDLRCLILNKILRVIKDDYAFEDEDIIWDSDNDDDGESEEESEEESKERTVTEIKKDIKHNMAIEAWHKESGSISKELAGPNVRRKLAEIKDKDVDKEYAKQLKQGKFEKPIH